MVPFTEASHEKIRVAYSNSAREKLAATEPRYIHILLIVGTWWGRKIDRSLNRNAQ